MGEKIISQKWGANFFASSFRLNFSTLIFRTGIFTPPLTFLHPISDYNSFTHTTFLHPIFNLEFSTKIFWKFFHLHQFFCTWFLRWNFRASKTEREQTVPVLFMRMCSYSSSEASIFCCLFMFDVNAINSTSFVHAHVFVLEFRSISIFCCSLKFVCEYLLILDQAIQSWTKVFIDL